ncbi:MAG: nucleoside-diphosphate sugar epimerase/dehydratase [Elusimicrobia bacterium]|nr:nucleoside-diphosphate sugar epimerase/dehydratase [Elusimicrobiota bacterium]
MNKLAQKYRNAVALSCDIAVFCLSYFLAFSLRFDFNIPYSQLEIFSSTLPIVAGFRVAAFYYFGLYKGLWRYASITDMFSVIKAMLASQIFILAAILFIKHGNYPRSVLAIDFVLAAMLASFFRAAARLLRETSHKSASADYMPKILIFGAGDLGESVLRGLLRSENRAHNIIGFIDDDKTKWGRKIHGIEIFGGRDALLKIISEKQIDEVLVSVTHRRAQVIAELLALCSGQCRKVQFKIVPAVDEILAQKSYGAPSPRKIALTDLLQRKAVRLDMDMVFSALKNKTALITGAGGTIGSQLCRQMLFFKPKKLIMLENHNTALFYIDREIKSLSNEVEILSIAGDVRDEVLLENMFSVHKPQIIFHAAAHKHVPLMEENPQEAIKNNTLATFHLAKTALAHRAEKFIFISTDKAVRPSSIMGASKRLGEMVIRALSGKETIFASVRFGNVLGSSGSAVKIFQEQIANGGPVTVTDMRATRYFMTTEEAIQLILQACAMAKGGELFVLNMGTPVKISDLAKSLIAMCKADTGREIKIKEIGLRAGEKLHEELFREQDVRKDTGHPDIYMAVSEEADAALMQNNMKELKTLADMPDPAPIIEKIKELIPAYCAKAEPQQKARMFK